MATRKINPGTLLTDGAAPLDGGGREYSGLVAQYMATNDDVSALYYVRARIAAVVGMRGVVDPEGKRLKMADVAAEWEVAPSTFSNARRSFGVLQQMGFNVESATPPEGVAAAHDIVKDRMRKFASEKVRVTLADGTRAVGKVVHDDIVSTVAQFSPDTDAEKFEYLSALVSGVTVEKVEKDTTAVETFLDAVSAFIDASDALTESGESLTMTQAEFLRAALGEVVAAQAARATVSTTA